MSNELIINSTPRGSRIALLTNKSLVEFHYEHKGTKFSVGDIYLGVVKKVVQGLNAAFVDVGYEKDAFLHYLDLGPNIRSLNKFVKEVQSGGVNPPKLSHFKWEPEIEKLGKIAQVLTKNQRVLVQVVKEPISTKGPRLTCELAIAGRYIVLVPFTNGVNISKKITDNAERQRLIRLISSIKPDNFGVIIRTVAEGKEVAEIDRDLRDLVQKWEDGMKILQKANPRDIVISEIDKATSILRDMLNASFDSITVDSKDIYDEIKAYIRSIAPDKEKILKYYSGKAKIFEAYGIEKQVKTLFGKEVALPGGGYLIIEHTEAMHVIDVNSGNKSNSENNQESTALNVNLEAAREIARQLRLRDMGGIIVVDFIDMKRVENKRLVYDRFKDEMKEDRSRFTILPLSKFGLMQITRERVRPELTITTVEKCPTCDGTGKISASLNVVDIVESNLEHIFNKQNEKGITIVVHPYVYAYFTEGFMSPRFRWFLKYKRWVRLQKDSSIGVTDFKFINRSGESIEVL